jgi:hypothetical protein
MYTVSTLFDGRVRYYTADSIDNAQYLAGVLTGDLINGQVRIDRGMDCLYDATVQDGEVVRVLQPDGSKLTPSVYALR